MRGMWEDAVAVIQSPALTLRVRQCVNCGQAKPWGDFYAAKRWPDGTMRRPYPRCKECVKQQRRDNPPRRTPEGWALHRDRNMLYHRRKRGTPPERYRGSYVVRRAAQAVRGEAIADPQPFLDWLQTLGPDAEHIGRECGIEPAQIRKYLSGAMVPTERTVDRAVTFAEQTHRLNDLLPLADTGE